MSVILVCPYRSSGAPVGAEGVVVARGRPDVLVANHLGCHSHSAVHHGLDEEAAKIFGLNRGVVAALFGNLGTQVCLNMCQIDAQVQQRELGKFTAGDLLNLHIGQAIVRMGGARDTFNVKIPLAKPEQSNRDEIIRNSRQLQCRTAEEVAELLDEEFVTESPKERVWIGDGIGNIFQQEQFPEYATNNSNPAPANTAGSASDQNVRAPIDYVPGARGQLPFRLGYGAGRYASPNPV